MTTEHERARDDLRGWMGHHPGNYFTTDHQLGRILRATMEPEDLDRLRPRLERFGAVAAGELERAAVATDRRWNHPRLDRFSPIGEPTEGVEHHPAHAVAAKAIYEDGHAIAVYGASAANLAAQAVFYLSSHAGEAGHNCPVACTAGLVKALQALGSPEMRERWLPSLLTPDHARRLHAAQFLTEVQGGSDVGANAVEARPDGRALGTTRWRIFGEKWFCSNADADLALVTARVAGGPPGTRGLGLFLVPRRLDDGRPNGYQLRRLKEKIGTRALPSAEIDFDGAVAYALGPVEHGFRHVMTYVIDTSRLHNTVACAGITRRAHLVARAYATHRRAFGRAIADYPLVREALCELRATSLALTAGGLALAHALDQLDSGAVRVATNLAKMRSCQHSHRAAQLAIEVLGGNGTIETFSVLPRLLRDNVVFENWEGTHNTLLAQSVRDFTRHRLHEGFLAGLRDLLDVPHPPLAAALAPATRATQRAAGGLEEVVRCADAGLAALMLRPHAEALADATFAAALARDVATEPDPSRREAETEALAWFCERHLAPHRPTIDAAYAARVDLVATIDN